MAAENFLHLKIGCTYKARRQMEPRTKPEIGAKMKALIPLWQPWKVHDRRQVGSELWYKIGLSKNKTALGWVMARNVRFCRLQEVVENEHRPEPKRGAAGKPEAAAGRKRALAAG